MDPVSLIRPNIRALKPYRSARDDHHSGILLDANENSLGPVLPHPDALHRYPDPHHTALRARVAAFRGCRPEQVFCGSGSDEAIDLLFRLFCEPGTDRVVVCPPTYGMYSVAANIHDVQVRTWPLTPDFQLDWSTFEAATAGATPKILFLCSPNNPTANDLRRADLERAVATFPGIVVVDEAYIDFSEQASFIRELDRHPNLVVTQTLSKAFGLAGIRLGFAFAHPSVIAHMMKVKAPYNLNRMTLELAEAAFGHTDTLARNVDLLKRERDRLMAAFAAFPAVRKVHVSHANYFLAIVDQAERVYRDLAAAGVVVRYRGNEPGCADGLRITVGSPEENDILLQRFAEVTA